MEEIDLDEFAPVGEKFCEGGCDREMVETEDDINLVCFFCKRIVFKRPKQ